MFSYKRLEDIFNYIRSNEYTSIAKLTSLFKVSDRTIRSDINNLNDVLQGASIQLKRRTGYYLQIDNEQEFNAFLNTISKRESDTKDLDSSQDRMRYILTTLLYSHDYIPTEDLSDAVFVSKNTFSNYIKAIKKLLTQYNLEYIVKPGVGVKVIGNESDKRECIINEIHPLSEYSTISMLTKEEKVYFNDVEVNAIIPILISVFKKHHVETDDYRLKNLTIYFALMISRILNDDYISAINSTQIPEDIKEIVDEICDKISNY